MTGFHHQNSQPTKNIATLTDLVPSNDHYSSVSNASHSEKRTVTIGSLDVIVSPEASVRISPWRRVYEPCKYALDFCLGMLLFILTSPVIVVTALAVRATSAGPAFYTQTRIGKGGRQFKIYKLRTMFHDCERIGGVKWSVPGDSRITPLGKILRVTHLDELPQLINVIKGEMSLVGPRPERPEIIAVLEKSIPHYNQRHQVRPGVTGLAQLRLPADTSVESVREKLVFDLHYIQVMGPWLDLRLILCTVFKMCKLPLKWLLSLSRVPGERAVESTRRQLTLATN